MVGGNPHSFKPLNSAHEKFLSCTVLLQIEVSLANVGELYGLAVKTAGFFGNSQSSLAVLDTLDDLSCLGITSAQRIEHSRLLVKQSEPFIDLSSTLECCECSRNITDFPVADPQIMKRE